MASELNINAKNFENHSYLSKNNVDNAITKMGFTNDINIEGKKVDDDKSRIYESLGGSDYYNSKNVC